MQANTQIYKIKEKMKWKNKKIKYVTEESLSVLFPLYKDWANEQSFST